MNQQQTPTRKAGAQRRKRKARRRLFILAAIVAIFIGLIVWLITVAVSSKATNEPSEAPKQSAAELQAESMGAASEASEEATEPSGDMKPDKPAYYITDEERDLIEQVVSAEARGESFDGQVAVAQCIMNACIKEKAGPADVIQKYKYTKNRAEATESVKLAVSMVFDFGEKVTDEPILYFYNPAKATSEFHESQTFVITIGNHKFFKEAE